MITIIYAKGMPTELLKQRLDDGGLTSIILKHFKDAETVTGQVVYAIPKNIAEWQDASKLQPETFEKEYSEYGVFRAKRTPTFEFDPFNPESVEGLLDELTKEMVEYDSDPTIQ
jgi:hypothetical protein